MAALAIGIDEFSQLGNAYSLMIVLFEETPSDKYHPGIVFAFQRYCYENNVAGSSRYLAPT